MKRVVLTGGGTGGHVYPALAIAEAIRSRDSSIEISFIGTASGFECKAIQEAGEQLYTVSSGGIVGKGLLHKLQGAAKVCMGVLQSLKHLRRIQPNFIIGTGGFVMVPVLIAARLIRVPYFLQEQNSYPGLSNRIFAPAAEAVFVAYPDSISHFKTAKTIVTGNPLRRKIMQKASQRRAKSLTNSPRILITGGSLGSRSINKAVLGALESLCEIAILRWQYGSAGIPESSTKQIDKFKQSGRLESAPFYSDMEQQLFDADLVVCRAGAMTLSEVSLFGVPAILVPYPHAAHDHQSTNARTFVERGAAELIEDHTLSSQLLIEKCTTILSDQVKYTGMCKAMQELANPKAADDIVDHLFGSEL